jgi:hypothetical protein
LTLCCEYLRLDRFAIPILNALSVGEYIKYSRVLSMCLLYLDIPPKN